MENFSDWRVEVSILGAWVDLTPDVLTSPAPRVSGIGILSNNPLDRVGGTSRFTFTLNNSQSNSVNRLGYYSPGFLDGLNGWNSGLYVRTYFSYDGIYKILFYGRIDADGIKVTSGTLNRRDVSVSASGWMREAEKQSVEMIEYATSIKSDEAVRQVLANMSIVPLVQNFQVGIETFPTVFDITSKSTKAAGEFGKIVESELGLLYVRGSKSLTAPEGGETLVFENRTHRYSNRNTVDSIPVHSSVAVGSVLLEDETSLLLEDGGDVLLESSQDAYISEGDFYNFETSYGKHLYNRARVTVYPRKVDASLVVLWNLEEPLEIAASDTIRGLRGSYRDPNGKSSRVSGINMASPVASTDYLANTQADGGGTNKTSDLSVSATYGTAEVEYIITNNSAVTVYVTLLQARGYGVYIYDTASVVYESLPSQAAYGVSEISLDFSYLSDATDLFSTSANVGAILLEDGTNLLLEDGTNVDGDDTAGIFDTLVYDEPTYYIERSELFANRDKKNMMLFMSLDAGSFVKLSDTMTNITTDNSFVINGYDVEVIPLRDPTEEIQVGVKWFPTFVSTLRYPST